MAYLIQAQNLIVILVASTFLSVLGSNVAVAQVGFPKASSKKGLQVENIDDAIELGVKHAVFNLTLPSIIRLEASPDTLRWEHNDRAFYFSKSGLARLDAKIKRMSDAGAIVYLVILVNESGNPEIDRLLLHPEYSPRAPNRLSAFNVKSEKGRQQLAATFSFLAHRWSRSDEFGQVAGYIIGNEVNSHWWWANRGECSMEEFCDEYAEVMRLVTREIKQQADWARTYISLEHHWNIRFAANQPGKSFAGRPFLERFAEQTADFEWHVAFHPYPENLFDPEFWKDETAQLSVETPRIGFENLRILVDFMGRPELHFEGQRRSIILSEQGFHTPDTPDGEKIQAAAYCYAYKIVEKLDGIDAFVLHRHIDHRKEGGLLLGLRRFNVGDQLGPAKAIYEAFKHADTTEWSEHFEFALPILNRVAW